MDLPEEGRFTVRQCETCGKHYCYDGQHFSEEDGPVPAWVKSYFDGLLKKMEQDRAEIARSGIAQQRSQAGNYSARSNSGPQFPTRVLSPSMQIVSAAPASPPPPPQVPKAVHAESVAAIKVGTERGTVIESLGTPQSSISIPEDEGVVETLNYLLTDGRPVRVKLLNGRVQEVQKPE